MGIQQKILRLMKLAEDMKVESYSLDNMVETAHSAAAQSINQDGIGEQIEYLIETCGEQETETEIRKIARENLRLAEISQRGREALGKRKEN